MLNIFCPAQRVAQGVEATSNTKWDRLDGKGGKYS